VNLIYENFVKTCNEFLSRPDKTRICMAEMAVRYAALSACGKVHVCHCNSLGGATWRSACRKVHPWC